MPTPFVTAKGTSFRLNSQPFTVTGFNCYFLAYCSDETRRAAITTARKLGASVIRAWAFLELDNFTPGSVAFQYFKDGCILTNDGPDGLQRLDALIKAAEDFDIKLILPLTNYWNDFGGMPAYVRWLSPGTGVTEFYRASPLRVAYQHWVHHILTRRNTLTGRLYSDEPSIMAWELTNEARCQTIGGRELLLDWLAEMSAFVKQRDSNHLLALGDEGHFHKKGRGHLYNGTYGVDWEANLALANMDFGTYHYYPQDWGIANDLDRFSTHWITDHALAAARLNKPVILEEYGLKLDAKIAPTAAHRNAWYEKWQNTARDTGTAGTLLWMLGRRSPETSAFQDEYVIYETQEDKSAEVPANSIPSPDIAD